MRIRSLQEFLKLESSSAIILFMMALIAMLWANSSLEDLHQRFISVSLFWVNEGLMAIFFLVVGLELKREYYEGQLSSLRQIMLPGVAALGGMIVPALTYALINYNQPETLKGWATPVATDIAFALGVLSLFGKRVPISLKLFLMALAIFDDVGAIILIAIFYTHGLSFIAIMLSLLILGCLFLLNRLRIRSLIPYLMFGILLWLALLQSGIHPTIAGVLLALAIPMGENKATSPLHFLWARLHTWVAYLIMPLFALVNAGIPLHDVSMNEIMSEITLGIAFGLFLGKQAGVFGFVWLLVKLGLAKLPPKSTWLELYPVAILCGIGFTMSLFLGTLSFQSQATYLAEVKLGVILGSLMSGLVGASVLFVVLKQKNRSSSVD